MENEILYLNKNIDDNLIKIMKSLKINIIYRISNKNDLIIKYFFTNYEFDDNSELFLTKKYLMQEFNHPNFLNYYAIIKSNNSYGINTGDCIEKLINYKNKISPLINNVKNVSKYDDIFIVMPQYEKLSTYLNNNNDYKIIFNNIIGILELCILIRDKYDFIHPDVKVCNIVVNNNIFYLIDWEDAFRSDEIYYHKTRPTEGNTEMYPFYDATAEQFLVHSIGVLIVRILGFHYEITHEDFVQNFNIEYILSKIPSDIVKPYEDLIMNIFSKKFNKIEELINSINKILDINNNG